MAEKNAEKNKYQGLDWELKSLLEYHQIEIKEWDEKEGVVVLTIENFVELLKVIKEQEDEIIGLENIAKDFGAPIV